MMDHGGSYAKRSLAAQRAKCRTIRLNKVGIAISEQDRDAVKSQLFRLMGKYDPRAIPRIISKRTGITEQAVDWTIQQTCQEYRTYRHEIEVALARADEAAAAVWNKRRSA